MSESIASEVVSAMVGGIFSASALYPLEVLKTRMQAETKQQATSAATTPTTNAGDAGNRNDDEAEDEGGVVLDNNDDDDDAADEEEGGDKKKQKNKKTMNGTTHASNSTQQLQKHQQQQQLLLKQRYIDAASTGMTSYAQLMYENEGGIAPFYSGVLTSAIQSATEKALYFFAYTFYKNG